ncbi:YkvA family protein [bacterium]|nr:YkvA family protein [bacterium]
MLARLKLWARKLKTDVVAIYIAGRDPRTPWHVKLVALVVAGYALSPIDLIPDFIPVLGYLDDLIIVPLGIMLVVKLMPEKLMAECRGKALDSHRPGANRIAGALTLATSLIAVALLAIGFARWRS